MFATENAKAEKNKTFQLNGSPKVICISCSNSLKDKMSAVVFNILATIGTNTSQKYEERTIRFFPSTLRFVHENILKFILVLWVAVINRLLLLFVLCRLYRPEKWLPTSEYIQLHILPLSPDGNFTKYL
jgi:hypothetical protein